jgi:predicted  nucleic acid-binding Zn-ribbon protein
VGRVAIDRLVELGREVGTLRGAARTAREEVRAAREARDEAERRTSSLAARVRDLEAKLEMAETNLRTILAAARGTARADTVGDAEMEAILGVLREKD